MGNLRSTFIFIGGITAVVMALQDESKALPFKSDCASMARYAKAMSDRYPQRSTTYTFQGFSGPLVKSTGRKGDYYCENGFVTEISPKGRQVCDGYIVYNEFTGDLFWRSGNATQEIEDSKLELERATRRVEEAALIGPARDALSLSNRLRAIIEDSKRQSKGEREPSCVWK